MLNPKILAKLKRQYPTKSENAIRIKLSRISKKHNVTLNAASHLWGLTEGFTVWSLLTPEDRTNLRTMEVQIIKLKQPPKGDAKKRIIEFISYSSTNKFLNAHLKEINKCYSAGCYTATFVLIRKVIENLIVEIIKKKFPDSTQASKELYLNLFQGRIHDLSILIKNLRNESHQFEPELKKLVQRILTLCEEFKNDANDKAHSLYHLCKRKELEDKEPQQILDLIEEFFNQN